MFAPGARAGEQTPEIALERALAEKLGAPSSAPGGMRQDFCGTGHSEPFRPTMLRALGRLRSRYLRHGRSLTTAGLKWDSLETFSTRSTRVEARFLWDLSRCSFRLDRSTRNGPREHFPDPERSGRLRLPPGRIALSDQPWVGRAGASIRLFLDENGNDAHDRGEPLLPGGAIQFDRASPIKLQEPGLLRASELIAYQRYTGVIDPASLKNQLWIPKFSSFSFIADPNRYKPIDVPFVVGGTKRWHCRASGRR